MVSVLITRPILSSTRLALELKQHGYDSVIEPLLSIVPTLTPLPADLTRQAVILTSGHTLAMIAPNPALLSLLKLPCFCVGARTAEKAKKYGFENVLSALSDGKELADLIVRSLTDKKQPILYIGGRYLDGKANAELQRQGFSVVLWPVYDAVPAAALSERTLELMHQKTLDAILVFSARTASILKNLIIQHGLQIACANLGAIGLSEAITDVLKDLSWRCLRAAPLPTEEAVIACLKDVCPLP